MEATPPTRTRRIALDAAAVALLAAAYFAAAKLGLSLAFVNASASAVWPPTGIAIAVLLVFGRRLWPGIFLGAFAANVTTAGTVLTSLGIAAGNTLEGLVAAALIARFAGGASAYERGGGVMVAAVLAVLATAVSATVGVTSLALGGFAAWEAYGAVWFTWWLGDAVGALVVAPLLVLWLRGPRPRLEARRAPEAALAFGALMVAGALVFGSLLGARGAPVEFVVLAPLVWVAFRFGPRAAATAGAVLSAIAIAATLRGLGPFGSAPPNDALILLQAFMGIASTTAIVLGAMAAEHIRSEAALRAARDGLEQRVRERTSSLEQAVGALRAEVADRVRAEERLRRSEAMLADAERIARLGSWEWDMLANRVRWSDELYRMYGLEPSGFEATYEGFLAHVHPEDRERVGRTIEEASRSLMPFDLEHRLVRPDGQVRVSHSRGAVFADASGQPVRMAGTALDITERKAAEQALGQLQELERLKELDAFKTQFLNIAAHELSTPLTPIRLQLSVLAAGSTPEQRRSLDILDRNVERLAGLVRDILAAARLQSGKLAVRRAPADLDAVVRDALETYAEPARQAGLALELRSGGPLPVVADTERLSQVMLNLLSNAWKFTPRGGRITVETAAEGGEAVVRVRDTGIGLRAEDMPRLFQPFVQVHDHDRKAQGTGLGLFISKGIVELHGGRIMVASDGPGHGATFTFVVPLAGAEARPRAAAAEMP